MRKVVPPDAEETNYVVLKVDPSSNLDGGEKRPHMSRSPPDNLIIEASDDNYALYRTTKWVDWVLVELYGRAPLGFNWAARVFREHDGRLFCYSGTGEIVVQLYPDYESEDADDEPLSEGEIRLTPEEKKRQAITFAFNNFMNSAFGKYPITAVFKEFDPARDQATIGIAINGPPDMLPSLLEEIGKGNPAIVSCTCNFTHDLPQPAPETEPEPWFKFVPWKDLVAKEPKKKKACKGQN